MRLKPSTTRHLVTRASILLCSFVLLALLSPPSAVAFLEEPEILPLMGQQTAPIFIRGGIVYEHRSADDQPADLWVRLDSGARSAIATGSAHQHSAAALGRFVAFVEEHGVGQARTFRLDVVDAMNSNRRATLVPATTTPLAAPSIHSGVMAWTQGRVGHRDVYGLRIDGDGNEIPDILENGRTPEVLPLAADPMVDAFSPALGAQGIVFASRSSDDGPTRIIHIPMSTTTSALVEASQASILSVDTVNRDPDPATAGTLVVWKHAANRVRIYDFANGTSVEASSGPGWSMLVEPTTDGTHVAWQAVRDTHPPLHQVFMRDVTGATFRVSPVSTNQFAPSFGWGKLAWGDSRWVQTGPTPNVALQCLASRRVQGNNRFETAVRSSELAFPSGSNYVLIATGRNWPDALGGSALAGVLDAPILLVEQSSIPASTRAEIARLGARRAIILGGTGVVDGNVQAALEEMHLSVERIGGKDRYDTAERIAAQVISRLGSRYDGTIFLATGEDFPDALAAAPIAVRQNWPLLLVHPSHGLTAGSTGIMRGPQVRSAVILGGDGAVSDSVANEVVMELETANVTRLKGNNRYETAATVATFAVTDARANGGHGWNRVGLSTGKDFPDALSGGVLQGKSGGVMLLTPPGSLHDAPAERLRTHASTIDTVVFFGGTGALSQAVRDSARNIVR